MTGFAASLAVNALATGMIVFRILKATGVKPTSVERMLGSTGSNKFRHIMFIVIESGMALLAIQLFRIVLVFLPVSVMEEAFYKPLDDIVIVIKQMFNMIIYKICSLFLLLLFC